MRLCRLAGPAKSQRIGGNVFGDAGSCSDVRAVTDHNWCDESRVASDEGAVTDERRVFRSAVVIAGNGARANVRALSYLRVAQIGQMIGLRSPPHAKVLSLDKIADMRSLPNVTPRPKMREGPEEGSTFNLRRLKDAGWTYEDAIVDRHVLKHRV